MKNAGLTLLASSVVFAVLGAALATASAQGTAAPAKTVQTEKVGQKAQTVEAPPRTRRAPAATGVSGPRPTTTSTLTAGECEALGGDAVSARGNVCISGEICVRTGANGVVYRNCITEK